MRSAAEYIGSNGHPHMAKGVYWNHPGLFAGVEMTSIHPMFHAAGSEHDIWCDLPTHVTASSSLPRRNNCSQSCTTEPCLALQKGPGRITPTLPRSRTRFTSPRRKFSLGFFSVRYSTVCRHTRTSIRGHPVKFKPAPGVVVALFFRCMRVLLSPVDRTSGGIKWGFVAHTVAMFSFVTAYNALNLSFGPTSYIDNRDFPGDSVSPPGPLGYQLLIISSTRSVVRSVMFLFNYWLADGLLVCLFDDGYPSV